MAAEAQAHSWSGKSRRGLPRFPVQAVVDVTVLRSGIPDTVPGRSVNVCERGIAAILAQELIPGEAVAVEVQLSHVTSPLRARAIVRHQDKLCSGLEFVGLPVEQRDAIRSWTRETNEKAENAASTTAPRNVRADDPDGGSRRISGGRIPPSPKRKSALARIIFFLLVVFAAALFWGRWSRGWQELESGLKTQEAAPPTTIHVQVPAEVMERLLLHRVAPTYPAEARKGNLQGIIAVDIVVDRDGSVVNMRPLNGPDVLARAAMDALRWWKFEPYRVNGEPAVVETTVAVEFKR